MERNGEVVSKQQKQEVADDFITLEILSRLPVKSLMRFKCVCKRWKSVIQKDKFFIDLHLSRSSTERRTSFLLVSRARYLLSAELLLPSNEEKGCVQVGTTCRWKPPFSKDRTVSVCSLNGLICFMDTRSSCARLYNSSTRESTPWIKSTIKQHEDKNVAEKMFQDDHEFLKLIKERWSSKEKHLTFRKHEFGYDPLTKEHKVIALWELYRYGQPKGVFFWEVMTVGQNSWRRINGIDPSIISPYEFESSVYVNGSIYFLCEHTADNGLLAVSIVEFSVGNETFRLVETLAHYICARHMWKKELVEVYGRLCELTYTRQDHTYRSIKMRILYDHENVQDKKNKMKTSSTTTMSTNSAAPCSGCCNHRWVEETISLPHFAELNFIRHIPGTDLLIIRSRDNGFSVCHFNQNDKSYSITKINTEISTALRGDSFNTFTPNLLPVN